MTREVRADGVTATSYAYETTTNRLKTATDPKSQVTTYTRNIDNTLQHVTYTNATIATPSLSFTYDPNYPRIATMVDGTGTTTYGYKAVGTLGANLLGSVYGPLTNNIITYDYDELRRAVGRAINGTANQTTYTYDALGRLITENNPLGTFTYGYDGVTSRPASVAYPNGQTSTFTYYPNSGDRRLQTIHNKYPSNTTLSKFDYTYDLIGNIRRLRQQADNASPLDWTYDYDRADQLLSAVQWTTDATPAVLRRYAYTYDAAANRTSEQIDQTVRLSVYDVLNRLTSRQAGGTLQVAGTVNKPATVTIQGRSATVAPDNRFMGTVAVASGTNTFNVTAVDASGNTRTQAYRLDIAGPSQLFARDANGNLISDGTRSLEWDAVDRLVAVVHGNRRTEYTYDGVGRRVRIVLKVDGIVTSDRRFVWTNRLAEERDSTGTTVTKRFFDLAVKESGVAYFYGRDHLGSVREVTDASSTIRARYAYDPYGRQVQVAGDRQADAGFTGHFVDREAGLALTRFRAYDADLGQWLSEDPIGSGVDSLYAYVGNEPIGYMDPLGLQKTPPPPPNIPGGPWRWEPDKSNERGGRWRDDHGNRAYWDEVDGHWDVDPKGANGQPGGGSRQRYSNRGNPLEEHVAHNPWGPKRQPIDFTKRSRGPRGIRGLGETTFCILGVVGMILDAWELSEEWDYCQQDPCNCSMHCISMEQKQSE